MRRRWEWLTYCSYRTKPTMLHTLRSLSSNGKISLIVNCFQQNLALLLLSVSTSELYHGLKSFLFFNMCTHQEWSFHSIASPPKKSFIPAREKVEEESDFCWWIWRKPEDESTSKTWKKKLTECCDNYSGRNLVAAVSMELIRVFCSLVHNECLEAQMELILWLWAKLLWVTRNPVF